MEVIDTIYKRRSIRSYLDKPVDREIIINLLKAATAAPTALNCQPWEFVVTDGSKLMELKNEFKFARYNAPNAIIVCGNMQLARSGIEQEFWIQDCSAAVQNILIAATSFGLGSIWIGIYPIINRVKLLRKIYNLPDYVVPLNVVPLNVVYIGYPAEEKEPRTRYNEKRVYWDEYDPKRKHRTKDRPVIGHY